MPESLKGMSRNDQIRAGAAVIFFIASFLPFVGVSDSFGSIHVSASIDAWHGVALLGLLIAFAAMIVWALTQFTAVTLPTLPVAWEILIPAAAALGTVLVALRGLTYSGTSLRFGFFLLVIAGIVFAVFTYDRSGSTSTPAAQPPAG